MTDPKPSPGKQQQGEHRQRLQEQGYTILESQIDHGANAIENIFRLKVLDEDSIADLNRLLGSLRYASNHPVIVTYNTPAPASEQNKIFTSNDGWSIFRQIGEKEYEVRNNGVFFALVASENEASDIIRAMRFVKNTANLQEHDRTPREAAYHEGGLAALENLEADLKTRFIFSTNQWSKGRNSGLIECCNIIDESLRLPQPSASEATAPTRTTTTRGGKGVRL
jgi:hypothetical protein